MLVATCTGWIYTLSVCWSQWQSHCRHHSHCDRDAAKVKVVTIIAEQRTWLKVLDKFNNFVAYFMVPCSYKNFCKYNFRNDHVITNITKIWSYTVVPSEDLVVTSVWIPRCNFHFPRKLRVSVKSPTSSAYFSICSWKFLL